MVDFQSGYKPGKDPENDTPPGERDDGDPRPGWAMKEAEARKKLQMKVENFLSELVEENTTMLDLHLLANMVCECVISGKKLIELGEHRAFKEKDENGTMY